MKYRALVLEAPKSPMLNKRQAFEAIADALVATEPGLESSNITQLLLQRERLGSTYVGNGIAIPHIKLAQLHEPSFMLLHLKSPIICDELNEKADLFLGFLIPDTENDEYLQLLDELVNELKNPESQKKIRHCNNPQELEEFLEQLPLCNSVT